MSYYLVYERVFFSNLFKSLIGHKYITKRQNSLLFARCENNTIDIFKV